MLRQAVHGAIIDAAEELIRSASHVPRAQPSEFHSAYRDFIRASSRVEFHYASSLSARLGLPAAELVRVLHSRSGVSGTAIANDVVLIRLSSELLADAYLWMAQHRELSPIQALPEWSSNHLPDHADRSLERLKLYVRSAKEPRFDFNCRVELNPAGLVEISHDRDMLNTVIAQYKLSSSGNFQCYSNLLARLCDYLESAKHDDEFQIHTAYDLLVSLNDVFDNATIVDSTDGGTRFQLCILQLTEELIAPTSSGCR